MPMRFSIYLLPLISMLVYPVLAAHSGTAAPLSGRILIVGYGQSNMGTFFSACSPQPCNPPDPPSPVANTFFYNGSIITSVPLANGVREMQNAVTTATGLPTVSIDCSAGGSTLSGFIQGTAIFNNCVAQVNAIITSRDKVFIIWDQGEGDAIGAPVPDYYSPTLVQLHVDLVAAIGRTTVNAPFITSAKGSASGLPGAPSHGTTQQAWQTVKNAQINAPLYEAGGGMIFSHTDFDFYRTDGYHYTGASAQKFAGQRFAQTINTQMGVASPSGLPNWSATAAAIIDATHTSVTLVHGLGTDFTPSSGGTSWEVSGDNGATWNSATAARTNATHIALTHSSRSSTNARLVRYLYGFSPPDVDINCDAGAVTPPCSPPSAMIFDNSSLTIPLSPTSWDLRSTGGSTLPMPTWRDTNTATSVLGPNHTVQTVSGLQLGPEQVRKMVILTMTQIDLTFSPVASMTITPQDFFGNGVGTPITLPTSGGVVVPDAKAGTLGIFHGALGLDAATATTFKLDYTLTTEPFGIGILNVETVPFADLNSTTPTASGTNHASAATSVTASLNASSGGLIVCTALPSAGLKTGSFTGSISGTVLTAGASTSTFAVGQIISSQDTGVAGDTYPNTAITSFGSGNGGAGSYNVNISQSVASQLMTNSTGSPVLSSSSGEVFALRWGGWSRIFDASNSPGGSPATATITFEDVVDIDIACASWR